MKFTMDVRGKSVEVITPVDIGPEKRAELAERFELLSDRECDLCGSIYDVVRVELIYSKRVLRRPLPVGMSVDWACPRCNTLCLLACPITALGEEDHAAGR